MRSPIAVRLMPFNLDEVQPRIDQVRNAFNNYLDYYVPKSSRSKHGLMGPVGKILSELKRGRTDPDYLKGYILRVHELSQRGTLSPEAVRALEDGIESVTALLRDVPTTVLDRLIDRLDYGLYFERRKKVLAWLEERNREYKTWLQRNYSTLEALNQEWGTQLKAWEQIRYAGPSSQTYKKASARQREDMNGFRDYLRKLGKPLIAEVETEEESA
jgi:hypothetical protein